MSNLWVEKKDLCEYVAPVNDNGITWVVILTALPEQVQARTRWFNIDKGKGIEKMRHGGIVLGRTNDSILVHSTRRTNPTSPSTPPPR